MEIHAIKCHYLHDMKVYKRWMCLANIGGKTKTCIIATISSSIHSMKETLGILDYAQCAKNIENKPEINLN
nr:kinesin-like protein KIN-5D [Tanacetum cinerariifolium]